MLRQPAADNKKQRQHERALFDISRQMAYGQGLAERNKKADRRGQPLSNTLPDEKSSGIDIIDRLFASIQVRVGEKGLEPLTSSV